MLLQIVSKCYIFVLIFT